MLTYLEYPVLLIQQYILIFLVLKYKRLLTTNTYYAVGGYAIVVSLFVYNFLPKFLLAMLVVSILHRICIECCNLYKIDFFFWDCLWIFSILKLQILVKYTNLFVTFYFILLNYLIKAIYWNILFCFGLPQQPLCTPIGASSKIIQLAEIIRNKDAATVSLTTWFISAFTNLSMYWQSASYVN